MLSTLIPSTATRACSRARHMHPLVDSLQCQTRHLLLYRAANFILTELRDHFLLSFVEVFQISSNYRTLFWACLLGAAVLVVDGVAVDFISVGLVWCGLEW